MEATGPGGRVLKEDVDRLKEKPAARPAAPVNADRAEEIVAMSPFRKRIAERLVQSQQTAALLTTFNEVDMSAVMELRKTHQEAFQEKYGIKLGFMSFFVKATIEALKLIPSVNGEIRGNDVVYKNFYDIGVAVGGGKDLRGARDPQNAERLSFAEVEQTIADFPASAPRTTSSSCTSSTGGTFTITNGGIYGSMMSTPIVNPPQSGILGLHAIQDRPMAVKGQVVIRPMMYVALTYDHRLVDGREAVTFLKRIKQCMEEPARIPARSLRRPAYGWRRVCRVVMKVESTMKKHDLIVIGAGSGWLCRGDSRRLSWGWMLRASRTKRRSAALVCASAASPAKRCSKRASVFTTRVIRWLNSASK